MWGLDVGFLTKITSMGGRYLFNDSKETPEVLASVYNYPDEGKIIQFEVRPWYTNSEGGATVGNIFYGDKGYLVVDGYGIFETFLGADRTPGISGKDGGPSASGMDRGAGGTDGHFFNFIEAVRKHDKSILNGPVETAHLASGLAHLGNVSYRTNRVLEFDPKSEKFVNDPEADKLLSRAYRPGFEVPDKM
jgi:hypothetical protein